MVAAALCLAGTVAAQPATPKQSRAPADRAPISSTTRRSASSTLQFAAAWNAHDPNKMASSCTRSTATLMEPDGATAKGRDEVEKHFADEHARSVQEHRAQTHHRLGVFPPGDVALVDGTYMVLGAVDPNGQPLPPRKGLLTSVMIKEHGTWHVAASRSMIPIPLPWRPK